MSARRSYGTGSLTIREDSTGEATYYGHVRAGGRRRKRALGRVDAMSKREAEAALRALAAELAEAPIPARDRLDVAELGRRYAERMGRRGCKLSSVEDFQGDIRVWLEPFLGTRPIAAITREDICDLVSMMEAAGKAPKTIRNVIGSLTAALNFAVKRGWLASNPVDGVDLPAIPHADAIRFLTIADLDALLEHVPAGPFLELDRAMLTVAARTGLRLGELSALTWGNVGKDVRVTRTYTRGRFTAPKSRRSERAVPLGATAADALETWFKASRYRADDDLVFTLDGRPLYPKGVQRRYAAARDAAGIDAAMRFHDLRHTFATHVAMSGVPMHTLAYWLGHASVLTTERHYAGYAPSGREAEMVERAFGGDNVVSFAG